MLIKLNYTNIKSVCQAFRAVNEIVNTPSITSISALTSAATAGSWASDVLQWFDPATSYIYRTKDTTGVTAHMCRLSGITGNYAFDWMVEFPTYDASSTKQYQRIYCSATAANTIYEQFGNSINTTIGVSQWPITQSSSPAAAAGTAISFTGTNMTTARIVSNTSNALTTLWVYITPYSMVWCMVFNNGTFQPSGWFGTNSAYSAANSTYGGPCIYSQYKRYDYWNTNANGVLPFIYTNPNNNSMNFLSATSELGPVNTNSATSTECPFYFFNYINAVPGTGTSFPLSYATRAAFGIGTRYSDTTALSSSSSSSTNATDPCYGAVLNTATVQTRIPSTDLLTKGFSILPITVRNANFNILGGSVSDVGDFYLFNGDYFPGDEFAYGGRTYVIFPVGLGYTTRLGLAIPKE